jgi:hypothetical protein
MQYEKIEQKYDFRLRGLTEMLRKTKDLWQHHACAAHNFSSLMQGWCTDNRRIGKRSAVVTGVPRRGFGEGD